MTIGKYTFEVVEKIPKGYKIWHIPDDVTPDYLLLCPDSKDYTVDMTRLKGIFMPDIALKRQVKLVAMRLSDATPSGITRYIKRYGNSNNLNVQKRIAFYSRMLPVMRSLCDESC